MPSQYLKEVVRDEFDLLHADWNQSFLQVGFSALDIKVSYKVIIIDGHGHNFAMSQKEVRDGVHFLYADKHQSFYSQTEAATGGVL